MCCENAVDVLLNFDEEVQALWNVKRTRVFNLIKSMSDVEYVDAKKSVLNKNLLQYVLACVFFKYYYILK